MRAQLEAADGTKLKWVFDDENAMKATKKLFKSEGIKGVELVYVPKPKK